MVYIGTNFYLFTNNKKYIANMEITDEPDFGYMIYIGKRSAGWLPLFQAHGNTINSIKDYQNLYNTGDFTIYDEYNRKFTWNQLENELIFWNGWVEGSILKSENKANIGTNTCPVWVNISISHFDPGLRFCTNDYFKDAQGYEFCIHEFS